MPNTKTRTAREISETLASKYLAGWHDTAAKCRALYLGLTHNAAELERGTSPSGRDRARAARAMATRVRRRMDELS